MRTAANKKPRFTDYSRLRPDAKGRITLGKVAEGVSSYKASIDPEGRILLEPFAEIPARERWLYKNPEALKMVLQGIKESGEGKGRFRGSFAKYANDDLDEKP